MTGDSVLDFIIGILALFGLAILLADELCYYKDKRGWRKK